MEEKCLKCHDIVEEDSVMFDGHCMYCWPGYDNCADPRCRHFRCEHDVHFGPPIYVRPGTESDQHLGPIDIDGCANAGCLCEKFQESN